MIKKQEQPASPEERIVASYEFAVARNRDMTAISTSDLRIAVQLIREMSAAKECNTPSPA